MPVSRREMLKRGLALVGAAVGIGAVGSAAASGGASLTLVVRGANLSLAGGAARPGERSLARADIEAGGEPGTFYATRVGAESTGHVGADAAAALEWHTFSLAGGTILGVGSASHNVDRPDAFAIVGGTGRYAGARGTYAAVQRHRELGGDGTAEFHMQFETGRA